MNRGKLVIVSGFSGAGKGTVMNELVSNNDNYALSVSATTRQPRPGETEGVSYFFKTHEEFEKMIDNDELLEYARYVDNYYGTPRKFVEDMRNAGKDVLLEIEIQGALLVKGKCPDAILIFITTKDAATLRERLTGRGTETEDVIEKRLKRAREEAKGVENYDYIVVNDNLKDCVETVDRIVRSEHNRTDDKISIIKEISRDLL
ncbi:MAG: guanylate kinase [Butyrivibrio sp.]